MGPGHGRFQSPSSLKTPSTTLFATEFDPASIMKYSFEAWMFKSGTKSKCFNAENARMSKGDIEAARTAYPALESATIVAQRRLALDAVAAAADLPAAYQETLPGAQAAGRSRRQVIQPDGPVAVLPRSAEGPRLLLDTAADGCPKLFPFWRFLA